ncbi:ABC transporter permease [Agarivorans sp. 1_MG-2023]|uniref:ABC transporter permease n=1 Tax=Agarivorans sp. 1_MG-2023 TaxID=3062634 RepID=UPI0026E270D5|nr:ABC transporter permease [Agarivorans sp. 1_MG-2023]MDO6765209.1 ABC transporter permease [Agarivorans sp. 1_MG-2023]
MLKTQARLESSKLMSWLSPLIAIVLTMLVSSIMFLALDINPATAFRVFIIYPLSDSYNLGELMVKTTPLLLCATGLALCYKANIWNIGAEGQLLVGALVGSYFALQANDDSGYGWLAITLLAGAVAGMLWAAIPTLLHQLFHTNLILTTIMLNYIGLYLLLWGVHGPLIDPEGFGFPESAIFADAVLLPTIMEDGRASISIVLAVIFAIGSGIILYRTLPGFQLRVFGSDQPAARYAGYSSKFIIWSVMLSAGALAGFAGVAEVTGPIGQLIPQVSPGYGYAAIIVAYLGRLNPFGIIFAAFFMGTLYMGSDLAQIELGMPTAITGLFQGILLFFLLACDFLIHYKIIWQPNKSNSQTAPVSTKQGAA